MLSPEELWSLLPVHGYALDIDLWSIGNVGNQGVSLARNL